VPHLTAPPHLLVAVLLLVGACGQSSDERGPSVSGPAFITATGDTVRMVESSRSGAIDADSLYQFTNMLWLLPRADGGVLVYDIGAADQGNAIQHFDANSHFVRSVGRQGSGPGEYGAFPLGTILVDGSLLISDDGQARFTRFDTAGALMGTWRGLTPAVDVAPASDGGWFVAMVTGMPPGKPREITYFHYDTLGRVVDSIPAPAAYRNGPYGTPGEPRAMTIILPDGRAVSGTTDTIAFEIDGPRGKQSGAHASDRVRYQPAERDALAASYEAIARSVARPGQLSPPIPTIPAVKQAYRYMVSDPSGRILFLRRTLHFLPADTTGLRPLQTPWRGTLEVDVFDSAATYRGRLLTPRDVSPKVFAFGADGLWLVHEGSTGELYLVKWKPERNVW